MRSLNYTQRNKLLQFVERRVSSENPASLAWKRERVQAAARRKFQAQQLLRKSQRILSISLN